MFCFFSILAPPSLPRPWFQVTWQHSDKIRLHLLAIKNVEFLFLQISRNIHVSKPLIIDPSCLTTTYTKTIVFPFFGSKVPFPRVWEVTGKWLAMSFTISVCLLSGQRADLEVKLRKQSEAESQVQQFASNRHRERMIEFLDANICYIYIHTSSITICLSFYSLLIQQIFSFHQVNPSQSVKEVMREASTMLGRPLMALAFQGATEMPRLATRYPFFVWVCLG